MGTRSRREPRESIRAVTEEGGRCRAKRRHPTNVDDDDDDDDDGDDGIASCVCIDRRG
jgi:hypothetical protein